MRLTAFFQAGQDSSRVMQALWELEKQGGGKVSIIEPSSADELADGATHGVKIFPIDDAMQNIGTNSGVAKIDLNVPPGQMDKYRALLLEYGALRVLAP